MFFSLPFHYWDAASLVVLYSAEIQELSCIKRRVLGSRPSRVLGGLKRFFANLTLIFREEAAEKLADVNRRCSTVLMWALMVAV